MSEKPKPNYTKTFIVVLVIAAAISYAYWYLVKIDYGSLITKYLLDNANAQINGSFDVEDVDIDIVGKRIFVSSSDFKLYDSEKNLVAHANGLGLFWSFRHIVNPFKKFQKISADKLTLNAARFSDGQWNFEKLINKKDKKSKIVIKELDVPHLALNIKDEISEQVINYPDIEILFERLERRKARYRVKLETHYKYPETNKQGLISKDFNDLRNPNFVNYIKITGDADFSSFDQLFENSKELNINILNLDAINFKFLNSLFAKTNPEDLNKLIDKYGSEAKVSFISKLASPKPEADKNLELQLAAFDFANIPEFSLDSKLLFNQDLNVEKAELKWLDTLVNLDGNISGWQEDNPLLNLTLNFTGLNLYHLTDTFSELKRYVPLFILEILKTIHLNDSVDGSMVFSESLREPKLAANLNLDNVYTRSNQKEQKVTANLAYKSNKLKIINFELPVDFSAIKINGDLDLEQDAFDINLVANDLPLEKTKPLIIGLPLLDKYRSHLERSIAKGYTTIDLNIKRIPGRAGLDSKTNLDGTVKMAKVNYVSADYPLIFGNLTADFEIKNDLVKINHIQSYIDGDYIETRGQFNLKSDEDFELEIAAPQLNAKTLMDSHILGLTDTEAFQINHVEGSMKDLYFLMKNTKGEYQLGGNLKFENVDLLINNIYEFSGIKGGLDLNDGKFSFENLSLVLGDSSFIQAHGSIGQDLSQPDLEIQAKTLSLVDLMELADPEHKYKLHAKDGTVDIDLKIKPEDFIADAVLNKVDFIYKGSKYSKYPVIDLNGSVHLEQDFKLSNANCTYGSSKFNNVDFLIKNFKTDGDHSVDLKADAKVFVDELNDFIPRNIKKFLSMKGSLPLTMHVTGNKQKLNFDMEAELSELKEFKFSNWLSKSDRTTITAKSKFFITPQLVYSDDSHLFFVKQKQDGPVSSRLNSVFQFEDYSNKDSSSYYIGFKTDEKNLTRLALIEPHITTLKPMNLKIGKGQFSCDTFGTDSKRQSICNFTAKTATARKYGIGDLKGDKIDVQLLSIAHKPLDVAIAIDNGDWHGIPYRDLSFDLRANGDMIYMRNMKAQVAEGSTSAEFDFNYKTQDSKFTISGHKLPAHELVEGVWSLGEEVPEGKVSGVFQGTTKGVEPDPMFFNLDGTANVIVRNGKLSSLVTMQKLLTAANTLKSFGINNVFQTLITYKGGLFDHIISSLDYDHGKVSSEKLLLKAEQIELNLNGYLDYSKDQLWLGGKGLIPKHSKSILEKVGIGGANLGNFFSLGTTGKEEGARFFDFTMIGPVSDMEKSAESLKSNFAWL